MLVRALFVLALTALAMEEVNSQQPLQAAEARAFFDRYAALGDAYDSSVAELYSDDGRIKSTRRYPDGRSRTQEMSGTQWKGMIRSAMPVTKARGERRDFKNVRVEQAGGLTRIKADRYSVRKCYWDRGYYMLISRQSDGGIKIVEEYFETQPQSDC